MNKSIVVVLFVFLTLNYGVAGQEGNGGDVIVYHNPGKPSEITKVELVDYFEAQWLYGFNLDLGAMGTDWKKGVQNVLDRIGLYSEYRSELYQSYFDDFLDETNFLSGVVLPDIPDTGDIPMPTNSRIEQIAIQREPRFPRESRYLINVDLWKHLDPQHKAGLILHEIVYRDAIHHGAKNSIAARYLNGLFSSDDFSMLSYPGYWQELSSGKIRKSEVLLPTANGVVNLGLGTLNSRGKKAVQLMPEKSLYSVQLFDLRGVKREYSVSLGAFVEGFTFKVDGALESREIGDWYTLAHWQSYGDFEGRVAGVILANAKGEIIEELPNHQKLAKEFGVREHIHATWDGHGEAGVRNLYSFKTVQDREVNTRTLIWENPYTKTLDVYISIGVESAEIEYRKEIIRLEDSKKCDRTNSAFQQGTFNFKIGADGSVFKDVKPRKMEDCWKVTSS